MTKLRWEVEQTETGWAVNGYSHERARFSADGVLRLTKDPLVESYPYLTREWAGYGLQSILRMERNARTERTTFAWASFTDGVDWISTSKYYKLDNKEVLTVSAEGQLIKFDLPYFVWAWVKNTPFAKLVKNFWYGWGKHD